MAQASKNDPPPRRSARNATKPTDANTAVKSEPKSPKRIKREASPSSPVKTPAKRSKPSPSATSSASPAKSPKTPSDKAALLQARKLKSYGNKSPFPDFPHPTPEESHLARRILASLHGDRQRPTEIKAPTSSAGCGNSPSVLDALVRTILSQNTSDKNSSRAKKSMDAEYGGSDRWEEIVKGGQPRLQKTIQSGGLSVVKSKVIISILEQAKEKYGEYSLDHLFQASNDDAMREMLSFQGVGPKTASCVLLFCLQRESFAVDTHVHRITGLLGWRPPNCSREESHQHLDARIPDEDKYALHVLIISHGKNCEECKAGGKSVGKCELRKAFRKSKVKGEAGEDVKLEEIDQIKKEEEED
ncbi:hhH-GPD superfamily base excision DNA repair protein [Sarocladium implicatum]|nr:hhH-GPD superfamily base excision DNA repair protein [Sarocladium implicatum]